MSWLVRIFVFYIVMIVVGIYYIDQPDFAIPAWIFVPIAIGLAWLAGRWVEKRWPFEKKRGNG